MIRDDFDPTTDLQSTCAVCLYLCDLLGKPDNRQLRMPDNMPEALDSRISVRTLIQTQTPENMLGRINGLWTAQNVTGDAIGAALLGGLGAVMTPAASASASGWALALVGVLLVGLLRELRRFQRPEIVNES